jgi:hypothetical protein
MYNVLQCITPYLYDYIYLYDFPTPYLPFLLLYLSLVEAAVVDEKAREKKHTHTDLQPKCHLPHLLIRHGHLHHQRQEPPTVQPARDQLPRQPGRPPAGRGRPVTALRQRPLREKPAAAGPLCFRESFPPSESMD